MERGAAPTLRKAIEEYERAIQHDPNMVEAYFYLGSSHQALYRPGKESAENTAHLEEATPAAAQGDLRPNRRPGQAR